jgi:cold shock CspA family protein
VTGKITRIVLRQGLGYITGEDDRDYVFHHSALPPGEPFDELLRGAPVTFDAVQTRHELRAEVVRRIPFSGPDQ